jgi:hypothetical protein
VRSFRVVLAGCYLVAVLTSVACGDIHSSRPVTVDPPPLLLGPAPMHTTTTTTTTVDRRASGRWYAVARLNDVARWNASARAGLSRQQTRRNGRSGTAISHSVPAPAPSTPAAPSSSIAAVMACIRQHESGDYTIHNHGYTGSSGAYQYLRGTWLAWSARAGYPGYDAAFLAPPAVQDAVTVYALSHGGAGNWSMRWGNDPCTAPLPGGG